MELNFSYGLKIIFLRRTNTQKNDFITDGSRKR
jgi:hypothetical protein